MIAVPVSQTAGHPLRRKDVLKVILMAERSCEHKYENKDELKEKAIQLYLEGKNYTKIAKELNISRNYVSRIIKDDIRVVEKEHILKVSKKCPKNLVISNKFLNKIGITNNSKIDEYIEISIDTKNNCILLKKSIK